MSASVEGRERVIELLRSGKRVKFFNERTQAYDFGVVIGYDPKPNRGPHPDDDWAVIKLADGDWEYARKFEVCDD